jgi:hypothetical protein
MLDLWLLLLLLEEEKGRKEETTTSTTYQIRTPVLLLEDLLEENETIRIAIKENRCAAYSIFWKYILYE